MIKSFSTREPNRLALKISSKAEREVRKEHPWLFESSIVKQNQEGYAGDLAIIFDQKKNKFLALGLFDPYSPIRVKLIQFKSGATIDEAWFRSSIQTAYEKRAPLFKTDTNSYRLVHGENDGLPSMIVDVYANVLVLKLYSAIWLPYMHQFLPILLDIAKCKTAVLRLSRNLQTLPQELQGLEDGQVIFGELDNPEIIFKEHGILFSANVIKGHKTGFFLDHRHNRKRIGELAKEKRVLDVFSYAGGFSVHALAGGAKEVISLDISSQALELAEANVQLNKLEANHRTMAVDAFEGLQQLDRLGKKFDLIIVDPPSFAKRDSEISKAIDSYRNLTKMASRLVAPNGILLMASCSSRVSSDSFFDIVLQTIRNSKREFEELERHFHDVDHPIGFPEGAYLKAIYLLLK